MPTTNRLTYIDAMRGLTIVLVVYSHALVFLMNHIDETLNTYFIRFRMPLFFFISGYFAYSAQYTRQLLAKRSLNRLLRQLYPTALLGAAFMLTLYDRSPHDFVYDRLKGGYWFTLVAVEMFVLVAPILFGTSRIRPERRARVQTLILLGMAAVATATVSIANQFVQPPVLDSDVSGLLSLERLYAYLPFFVLGIVFRINEQPLSRLITNKIFVVGVLTVFFFASYIPYKLPRFLVEGASGVCVVYYFFWRLYRFRRFEGSWLSRQLQRLGSNTLEIYLLHYFIIASVAKIPGVKLLWHCKGQWWESLVAVSLAVAITYATLLVANLLRRARIYKYLFGKW